MKTIVETSTGKVLYAVSDFFNLQENQTAIDELLTEAFIQPYYNFETFSFYEGATPEQVNSLRVQQALELDLQYTNLISEVLKKHIEKLTIDGIPIPQEVMDERDRLRAECNQKIMDLGITNFAYRQSNLKL